MATIDMNPVKATALSSPYIEIRNLSKTYAGEQQTLALKSINLEVGRNQFISLVGPSGCGKSTLLQIVAGLVSATSGEVRLAGTPVTGTVKEMVYVFQQYTKSIFPWKTVLANVAFGLQNREKLSRTELFSRCVEHLEMVGLSGFERYYPWQLSGGMQQRVAIARALVCRPDVLLMDEPFSSVDSLTRAELQDLLLGLWTELPFTVVFVTHDIEEAIYLSDKVVILGRSPAVVVKTVPIEIKRPRNQIETRESADYLEYRHSLLNEIFSLQRTKR